MVHPTRGKVQVACNNFIREPSDLLDRLEQIINGEYAASVSKIELLYGTSAKEICISCGMPLEIDMRGRRKYCAHCGCYLPEILYDHRFTELVKPMDSVKPSRLGTVYTH
jgi:DNA-directed RNA polymerase subunit RPC12/RpoP